MATYTVKGLGMATRGLMPVNYNPMRPVSGRKVEGGHRPDKQPRTATAKACAAKATFGYQGRTDWSYQPKDSELQTTDRAFVRMYGVTPDPVRKFR